MNKETLERAIEIQTRIKELEIAKERLDTKYDIALCFWVDRGLGYGGYEGILTLSDEEIIEHRELIEKRIARLEKEFEKL